MLKQKKTNFNLTNKVIGVKKRGRPRKKDIITKVLPQPAQPEKIKKIKRNYFFSIGRRKESIARVRFYPKEPREIIINNKKFENYFNTFTLQKIVLIPFDLINIHDGKITIKVNGGGKRGQAESIRLGLSRVLEKFDPNLRKILKRAGLLKRDARVKERKKYGLKRARRAPQWQKR